MRSSSRVSRKSLAFITALATLLALAVPLVGTAGATHGGAETAAIDVDNVTLTPESSSAPSGACQVFTAQATSGGQVAEGETLDISATISDPDTAADATIDFCVPTTGTSSAITDSTGADTDDGPPGPPTTEAPATIHGECLTDANGQCRFGIRITDTNANSTGTVTVWADRDNDDVRDAGEPFDQSTIAVTPSGNEAVTNISCTPASDFNPEGTRHEFQCTATNASGQAVPDATITFDVTAGPNAEEVGPQTCGPTNQQGQTVEPGPDNTTTGGSGNTPGACGYQDVTGTSGNPPTETSPPGTDTITVCVTQQAGAGETQTAGCDPHETQTTISKTWVGPGNTISCTPDGQQADPGSSVLVTCTVTDINGQPTAGERVRFSETGPGTIGAASPAGANASECITDAQGQCTVTATTASNERGTQTITGTLVSGNCSGGTGAPPNQPGTPNQGTNAQCTDTATINWQEAQQTTEPPPDQTIVRHDRNISINFNHVKIPNRRGKLVRWLEVRGQVTVPDDFTRCSGSVPVKVQIRAEGRWITRKSDTTSQNGRYGVIITDAQGRHRAVAPRFRISNEAENREDRCNRTQAVKRHRHRNRRR